MEFFTFLALVILIVIVVSVKNNILTRINELSIKMDHLKNQLAQFNSTAEKKASPAPEKPKTTEEVKKEAPQPFIPKETILPPKLIQRAEPPVIPPVVKKEEPPVAAMDQQKAKATDYSGRMRQPPVPPPPTKPSFFERNPDLEKFIGENLINKIGIGILVLGIGFFVKYAISQNWINEIGRTAIGILCGGILIALAHKLRKTFSAFSSVLVGGGLAVLYFTITISFHQYHIFSQTVAFIIMVFITAFAVVLSISYDRKELAILAIIGGFSSPFMVSTGEGNYVVLFTYITILNLGMLTLAYFKKWNVLNIISYLFTIVLYAGWLLTLVIKGNNVPYLGALLFATIFYLVFFLMNIIHNIKESRSFQALEITMLLSNTFLYYAAGMYALHNVQEGQFQGLFTALVGVFNFIFAYFLYKNEKVDKNLVFLLIGLVLTFISLAAPIQLKGNHITLFWSAEAVLLLWLSQKSGIQLMKKASMVVMLLMFVSLLLDWQQIYFSHQQDGSYENFHLTIAFNKGFITSMVAVVSIFISTFLLKKEEEKQIIEGFSVSVYQKILYVVMLVFLYTGILLELNYQLDQYISFFSTRSIIIGCYNYIFLIALNLMVRKKAIAYLLEIVVVIGFLSIVCYLMYYHTQVIAIRNACLMSGEADAGSFIFHYLDIALVVSLLVICYKNLKLRPAFKAEVNKVIMWYISIILIFIASAELDHLVVLNSYYPGFPIEPILNQNHKIGFPILWGICSFILMFVGMRVKRKDCRIISLTLFLIIILKLFIFDIRGISEGGKIAAFISLGVILLVVSFMYQKLKKLILEDDIKAKTE